MSVCPDSHQPIFSDVEAAQVASHTMPGYQIKSTKISQQGLQSRAPARQRSTCRVFLLPLRLNLLSGRFAQHFRDFLTQYFIWRIFVKFTLALHEI